MKMAGRKDDCATVSLFVFLDEKEKPDFFVRIPRNPKYGKALKEEYDILSAFHSNESINTKLKKSIPYPLVFSKVNDLEVLLESVLEGKSMSSDFSERNAPCFFRITFDWLVNFHKETEKYRLKVTDSSFVNYLKMQSDLLLEHVDEPSTRPLRNYFDDLIGHVRGFTDDFIPFTAVHYDFSPFNILVTNKGINVIDWEDCVSEGCPFVDLFHFLVTSIKVITRKDLNKHSFEDFYMKKTWLKDLAGKFIQEYCREMQIDVELISLLFPFYLTSIANKEWERNNEVAFSSWVDLIKGYSVHELSFRI